LNRRRCFSDYGIGGSHDRESMPCRAGDTMKSWSFRAALALSLAASLLALAQAAYAERRIALVIGNNDYKNVPRLVFIATAACRKSRAFVGEARA
jgi:hypothetical protein